MTRKTGLISEQISSNSLIFLDVKFGMGKGKGGKPSTTGRPSGKGRDNNPPSN